MKDFMVENILCDLEENEININVTASRYVELLSSREQLKKEIEEQDRLINTLYSVIVEHSQKSDKSYDTISFDEFTSDGYADRFLKDFETALKHSYKEEYELLRNRMKAKAEQDESED